MIERPQVGARVTGRRKGVGTVVGPSIPMSRFYVSVTWDNSGRTENALIEDLCPYEVKEKIQQPKDQAARFRSEGLFYQTAGRLLRSDVLLEVCVAPQYLERVLEQLDGEHIDYELGRTVTIGSQTSRGCYWLMARNTGWAEPLRDHFPNVHQWGNAPNWRVLSSKPFVLHFLLVELGFSLGRKHDLGKIIDRVPPMFHAAFEEGLFG